MQFINTLSDNIWKWGAMETLITNGGGGECEISKKVNDLLCSIFISQYESESFHQYQNKSENHDCDSKQYVNTIMNLSGCPASCWLLCLSYVCVLLNVRSSPALGGITPLQALTGPVPDISFLIYFSFWEPVYYKVECNEHDSKFPSQSNEKQGHWVKTREISSLGHGRSLLMIPRGSSFALLS